MYKTISFKKKILATAVASAAVAASFSGMTYAQEDGSVEEVMVTGIRASLTRAVDVKRNSPGVVDAISSEDLGKMPDSNLAESLQRITGISIDRTNGEGAKITSRGFGPAYNLVTLNGRQLSSASVIEGGDVDSTRSFDMSNIASESVNGVQVYKTGKASVPTGGIGATVNLTTAKPFDYDGFKASIGGKALYDESNDVGDDVTPELSGFASWSNDMFGASLSLAHQERDSGRSGFANSGWGDKLQRYAGGDIFNSGYTPGAVVVNEPTKATPNVPGTGDLATRLQEANFFHTDTTRERDNALLTLQFRPTEALTATLDVLSVNTKIQSQHSIYSLWFSDSAWPTNAVQWDDSSISKSPLYVWQANPTGSPRDIALKNSLRSIENKLDDVGFNLAYQASDELSFALDVHKAESSATPYDAPGSNVTLGIGVNTLLAQGLDMSGDLPLIASVVQNGEIKKSDVGSTISQLVNARAWQDVEEAKVSGKYEFSESGSINFGLTSLQTESIQKQSDIGNATMRGGWSVMAPGDINPDWFELINFNDYFDGYNSNLSAGAKDLFTKAGNNGSKATSNITGVRVTNFNAVAEAMFADSPDKIPYAANKTDSTDRKIVEDVQAAYVETNLTGNLGGMEVDVSAGLRYETTDVESYSRVSPRKITWTADRDFNNEAIGAAGSLPYTVSKYDYTNVLPNLDLTFHISDDLIARASSSKTISRANYNDLQMGAAGNAPRGGPLLAGGSFGTSSDGNVKLKPIESNNIDFSVEYYFNDTDYVSIGFFDKRVPNFIGREEVEVTYAGTQDPSNGPRALAAAAALNAAGIPVTERNLFEQVARMNTAGCINTGADKTLCGAGGVASNTEAGYLKYSNGVDIEAVAGDPGVTNITSMPTNSKDAVLNGWEFAGQHFFGDSGFGIQANYTVVNGSISYDLYAEPGSATQFALTGLSDSANLIGIYENDQWQARIAYNWRDKFLSNSNVGGGEPEFTDDYGQVDFNVGYKVTEDLTVSFEGTNVLAEDKKAYGRTQNQVRYVDILEARYALSARYNF
ncbi:TonB-dependent receptor [Cellvibrio sp. KY-GH-1]|uniref:TonB-dependent receptor n=1 Tax=Cellvibrio sp. KY-GH-1 TaxID=2303332 RepID=UPI001246E98B|nr:TonB-dependent receptor [Cellvibrio sp. KY-GH-1]QEY15778.1 TonB-dependent receptor [Cellvibrio sp. KY-GH-1]